MWESRTELLECWICRDAGTSEPLVRPCRCRGSMGGVHASCVEAWIHRTAGTRASDEAPACPVCRTPYGGQDCAPGWRVLVRQLTRCFGQQLLLTLSEAVRFIALGTLLVHFCRQPQNRCPHDNFLSLQWISANMAALLLAVFLFHTLAVLLASLPPTRNAPQNPLGSRFYTADTWRLARHVAELLATVLLLGGRWIYGDLPLAYFLPVCLVALLPLLQLLLWYRPADCCKEAALMLGCLVTAPLGLALELAHRAWHCRLSFCNPRHGPLHLLLALLACPLALLRYSRKPALVLFTLHSLVMAAGLLDRALRWAIDSRFSTPHRCCCCCGILKLLDRSRTEDSHNRMMLVPQDPQLDGLDRVATRTRDGSVDNPWRPGKTWFNAVLVALEAFSLAVQRKWVTLFLLLLALRALQRAAVEPPPPLPRNGRNGIGSLLLQGPLWWCSLLVAGEASGLVLRELRPDPEPSSITSAAVVWLMLLIALACSVNWTRCQAGYRRWQRRNSTFVLSIGQGQSQ